jgi:hypothetical protein
MDINTIGLFMHKEFSDAWNHKLLTFEHFSILQECMGSANWTSNSAPNMQVKTLHVYVEGAMD